MQHCSVQPPPTPFSSVGLAVLLRCTALRVAGGAPAAFLPCMEHYFKSNAFLRTHQTQPSQKYLPPRGGQQARATLNLGSWILPVNCGDGQLALWVRDKTFRCTKESPLLKQVVCQRLVGGSGPPKNKAEVSITGDVIWRECVLWSFRKLSGDPWRYRALACPGWRTEA